MSSRRLLSAGAGCWWRRISAAASGEMPACSASSAPHSACCAATTERLTPAGAAAGRLLTPTPGQGRAGSLHQDDHHPLPEMQRAALFAGIVQQSSHQQVGVGLTLGLQRFQHASAHGPARWAASRGTAPVGKGTAQPQLWPYPPAWDGQPGPARIGGRGSTGRTGLTC